MIDFWCISVVVAPLVLLYLLLRRTYTYWSRKGFPFLPPEIPWGCLRPVVVQQTKSFGEQIRDIHLNNPNSPYLGLYIFFRPSLLIRDAELVKRVLVTDFDHFTDRGMFYNEETDPVGANLFIMPGQKWRDLRHQLTPTFTSGKLKGMFSTIAEKTQIPHDHLEDHVRTSSEVRLKDFVSQTNISILASVFFGLEMNAIKDPNHEFVQMGKQFFETETLRQKFTNLGIFLFPEIFQIFKIPVLAPFISNGATHLIQHAIKVRKAEPLETRSQRHDFIQTIVQLNEEKLSMEMCAAQAFLFYGAGYETSSTTATFCLFELTRSPLWMTRVQWEIDVLMKKRNGKPLYEDLAELKSLNLCLKETMRKYPALPLLNRECTKEYRIPGTQHVIPKGTPILVSNFGLHMEEKYFPDPEKFDPSRFEGDERPLEKFPYYPVGGGPRNCIGKRIVPESIRS